MITIVNDDYFETSYNHVELLLVVLYSICYSDNEISKNFYV